MLSKFETHDQASAALTSPTRGVLYKRVNTASFLVSRLILSAFPLFIADQALGAASSNSKPLTTGLREVINDLHAVGADHWIYNDFEKAITEAKSQNKPIFVTFRCVPCKACASFDAEVAKDSEIITKLAKSRFVSLRQVEMKGVDLTQFQFDHDLNWAAMFINADGTVYGRYGTQSAQGPDAYNSIASLEKAMRRVLSLHAQYPRNSGELIAKRPQQKTYRTALEMPGLENKERLRGPTARNNCIHCHNIHDAETNEWQSKDDFKWEKLYRYPFPDNIGVHIDPRDGTKIESVLDTSPAAIANLRRGDQITHVNGQAIVSIADVQWVLHHLPNSDTTVEVVVARGSNSLMKTLNLAAGWKKTDISWRGSLWATKPQLRFWAPLVEPDDLQKLGVANGNTAFRVQFINQRTEEGKAAQRAGLKANDFIVEIDGKPFSLSPPQFHLHLKEHYGNAGSVPLTVVRNGNRRQIKLPLIR